MTVYFSSSKLCYDGEILSVYCNSLFDNYLYPTERKYWPVDVWCYWGDNQALSKFSAGRWSNDIIIQNSLSPIRVVPQTIQYSWIRDWWRHNSSRYNNQFLSKYFRRWILLASSFGLLNTDLFMERQNFFFLVHIALSFTCRHTRLVPTFVENFDASLEIGYSILSERNKIFSLIGGSPLPFSTYGSYEKAVVSPLFQSGKVC